MDPSPLVREEIDAGARFLHEFGKYAPVTAAFWLQHSETGRWYLYIASDQIDENSLHLAHGEVIRLANQMQDPNFDPFQVRLLGRHDPRMKAALALQQQQRGRARVPGGIFGRTSVDGGYMYPLPIALPA